MEARCSVWVGVAGVMITPMGVRTCAEGEVGEGAGTPSWGQEGGHTGEHKLTHHSQRNLRVGR